MIESQGFIEKTLGDEVVSKLNLLVKSFNLEER